MDLEKELSNKYSMGKIKAIATYACTNKMGLDQLMEYFIGSNQRLAQMASWCVSHTVDIDKSVVLPYVPQLIDIIHQPNKHDAVIRNSIRIFQFIEIPETYHGKLMNKCFEFVESPTTPAAFKAYALTVLFNLSKIYPDIKPELKTIIETLLPNETPAFKSRGKKILNELNKK